MDQIFELSPLISDGMVLQRGSKVCLWGKAVPGVELELSFRNKTYQTKAGQNGEWEIVLMDLAAGGPDEMTIQCGEVLRSLKDIYVGDVWVLAGQSNMEIPVKRTLDLFEEEVKGASCPTIRKFNVPQIYNFHGPVEEITGGSWVPVTPESVYDFSAIGYFFAKNLQQDYNIPIGLIHTAIGGTPAEAWISEKTLMRFGRFQEVMTLCKDDEFVNGTKLREEMRNNRWYSELYEKDPGLREALEWYKEDMYDSDWQTMELPASFRGTELEPLKGSVWFRKEVIIPEELAGKSAMLKLGTIVDGDDTYINGIKVGNTGYLYPPRRYNIPEGVLKPGKNVLTVRVILTQNIGAFVTDMPYYIAIGDRQIPISGTWRYRIGAVMGAPAPTTFFQYKPSGVFNGMIYPIRKYTIQGVLWYQGESNTGYPYDYKELFEAVIKDWRASWGLGDFPFLYVQLANFCPWRMEPETSGWARVREEQRKVLELPNTGMAVICDVGMYNDLHPWNKKTVGERLALWARKLVFHENIACSGPIYDHMQSEGDRIRVSFKHTGGGLVARGGVLKGFSICGKDGIYMDAEAMIDQNTVLVSNPMVTEPVAVRYAWADNPEDANLYNQEGLPASPFITEGN